MNSLLDSIVSNVIVQIVFWVIVGFALVFDIALAWWVYRDISSRRKDTGIRILATIFVLIFNLPGLLLYVLFRPMQTLHEREMEKLEAEIFRAELEEARRDLKKDAKSDKDEKSAKKDEKKEDKKDSDKEKKDSK